MKKIDAHSHLGEFGGWAGVSFTAEKLLEQMEELDIEKTFLTASSFQTNEELARAYHKYPDKIVPMVWMNPLQDNVKEKLDHYILDEGFAGIKMQPLFDAFVTDDPVVYPVMDYAQEHDLPSAPKQFIQYMEEDNRPQVALDVNYEGGMGVSIGRLREDTVYDWKFIGLSHNTLRGAAGGAVLCAETLVSLGYITAK